MTAIPISMYPDGALELVLSVGVIGAFVTVLLAVAILEGPRLCRDAWSFARALRFPPGHPDSNRPTPDAVTPFPFTAGEREEHARRHARHAAMSPADQELVRRTATVERLKPTYEPGGPVPLPRGWRMGRTQ